MCVNWFFISDQDQAQDIINHIYCLSMIKLTPQTNKELYYVPYL